MKRKGIALFIFLLLTPIAYADNGNDYWWDTSHAPTLKTRLVLVAVNYINVTYPDLNISLPQELQAIPTATGTNYSSEGWGWIYVNCTGFIWFETPDFWWEGRGWVEEDEVGVEELAMVLVEPEPMPMLLLMSEPEPEPEPEPENEFVRSLGKVVYEDGLTPLVMWNTPHFLVAINLRNGAVNDGGHNYEILLELIPESIDNAPEGSPNSIIRSYEMKPIHKYLCVYFKLETINNLGLNYQIRAHAITQDDVTPLSFSAYESVQQI